MSFFTYKKSSEYNSIIITVALPSSKDISNTPSPSITSPSVSSSEPGHGLGFLG